MRLQLKRTLYTAIVLLLLFSFSATSCADVSWDDLAVQSEMVTYTDEDALRYEDIYNRVLEPFSDEYLSLFFTLEQDAMYEQELLVNGKLKTKMYHALPKENDLTEQGALKIAYAYLEKKGLIQSDELDDFFPRTSFFAFVDDDVNRVWQILFLPLWTFRSISPEEENELKFISYTIYIHATDGTIVRVYDQDDAAG